MLVLSGTAYGQERDTQLPEIFGDLSGNAPESVLDVEDPIITDMTHGRNALCGPRRPPRHACTTRAGACYPNQSQTRTLTLRIARSSNTQTASRRTHRRYAVANDALHVPLLAVMPQKNVCLPSTTMAQRMPWPPVFMVAAQQHSVTRPITKLRPSSQLTP